MMDTPGKNPCMYAINIYSQFTKKKKKKKKKKKNKKKIKKKKKKYKI